MNELVGASPYNAATIAGADNLRRPSKTELSVAKQQVSDLLLCIV